MNRPPISKPALFAVLLASRFMLPDIVAQPTPVRLHITTPTSSFDEKYLWTPAGENLTCSAPILDVSLVKEESSPRVYFICGGKKLWIPSVADFDAVGFDWAKIQVVPDGALNAYQEGFFSAPATIKPSDVFFDCGENYTSPLPPWGRWIPNCVSSKYVVRNNVVVAGWLLYSEDGGGDVPHINFSAPRGVEDIFYDIKLDPDFVDKMYGPNGLTSVLDNESYHASYPGNPNIGKLLVLADTAEDGTSRGITYNSFILPEYKDDRSQHDFDVHGELNAWHPHDTNVPGVAGEQHFLGRGPAPAGWQSISFYGYNDVWWPFNVTNPDDGSRPLRAGDYVIMKGSLYEDSHDSGLTDPWNQPPTESHYARTEMHPVDWVVRVNGPKPAYRKTVRRVQVLAMPSAASESISEDINPDFTPAAPSSQYSVGDMRELIDGRFTDMSTLSPPPPEGRMVNRQTHVTVTGTVTGTATTQGRFKAAYIIGWREKDSGDEKDSRGEVWVEDIVPAGAKLRGDMEKWNWVASPLFSGAKAHQSANQRGRHQHYFFGTSNPLNVAAGDTLFACVYLDQAAIPCEVMLQWASGGTWEHRAYWGANLIDWGTDGTATRRFMGPISIVGQWVRLEVPASLVGLEGKSVDGMAFTLQGGRATWDYTGKRVAQSNQFNAQISAFTLPPMIPFIPHSLTVPPKTATVTVKNTGTSDWNAAKVRVSIKHVSGSHGNSLTMSQPTSQNVPSGSTATFNLSFGCAGPETCSVTVQMEANGIVFGNSMTKVTECQQFDSENDENSPR